MAVFSSGMAPSGAASRAACQAAGVPGRMRRKRRGAPISPGTFLFAMRLIDNEVKLRVGDAMWLCLD